MVSMHTLMYNQEKLLEGKIQLKEEYAKGTECYQRVHTKIVTVL